MYQRAWTSSSGRHTGPKPIVDSCDRLRLYHSLAIAECESQLVGHTNCVTQSVRIATLPVHLADHQIEPNSETLNPGPQLFIFISCIMCLRYVICNMLGCHTLIWSHEIAAISKKDTLHTAMITLAYIFRKMIFALFSPFVLRT